MKNSAEKKQNLNEKINTCKFCETNESVTDLSYTICLDSKYKVVASFYYCSACFQRSMDYKKKLSPDSLWV